MHIVGTIEGVEIPQTMWQAWRMRDGLLCWWDGFRSEAEASQPSASTTDRQERSARLYTAYLA